jgi:SOS-response transcriptional repressor LexA
MRNRDSEHLVKLRDYYARHGVMPSFSGISKLLGFRSTAAVAGLTSRLKEGGYLTSTPDRRLCPGDRFFEYPQVETIQAGNQISTYEIRGERCNIIERLVGIPSRTVILKVRGESMTEAGLLPGDYVVIQKGGQAKVGDIVVAPTGQDYTVKFLARDDNGYYLKAGNKEYKDIRPLEMMEIFGVVTGAFRQYKVGADD